MHESGVLHFVILIMGLLMLSSLVAIVARRVNFPFTILLVVIGLFTGWAARSVESLSTLLDLKLTPEVVLFIFLPVLLFESAFNLDARRLIKNVVPVATLAVPGLLISTAIVGVIVHYLLRVPMMEAMVFGALISATDPVAVVALFKEMGAPKRLNLLVEGESLFNDGTALVVFKIILGVVATGVFSTHTLFSGVWSFIVVSAGGIITGIVLGYLFAKVIGGINNDPLVEITLTTILAHSAFITAEHLLHVSGVMSTVAAGLTMGSYGRSKVTPPVLSHMEHFWEHFAFICNSFIFLLVGLSIEVHALWNNIGAILVASVAVLVARAASVYGVGPVIDLFKGTERVSPQFQAVIVWGGLRGALAIVMALSLPEDLPSREFFLTLTLGVVLFSLVVNGLTIKRLMHLLKLDRFTLIENLERMQAVLEVKGDAMESLRGFSREGAFGRRSYESERSAYESEIDIVRSRYDSLRGHAHGADESGMLLRHCLAVERGRYRKLFEIGLLNEDNLKDMNHAIERQLDRIKEKRALYMPGRRPLLGRIGGALGRLGPFVPLMARYKTRRIAASYEVERARLIASGAVLEELEAMREGRTFSDKALDEAIALYSQLRQKARTRMDTIRAGFPEYVEKAERGMLRRFLMSAELGGYQRLFKSGMLQDKAYHEAVGEVEQGIRMMSIRPVKELNLPPQKLMAQVPIFAGLPEDELTKICAEAEARSFLSGENVVAEGEEGDSLFVIGRGKVGVYVGEGESEKMLATLGPGEFFGETAFLHPQPRTATVRAMTHCTLLELGRREFMPFVDHLPRVAAALEAAFRERIVLSVMSKSPDFADRSPGELKEIIARMKLVMYEAGQVVEPLPRFMVIKNGALRVQPAEGTEVYEVHSGGFVSSGANLRAEAQSATEAYVLEG